MSTNTYQKISSTEIRRFQHTRSDVNTESAFRVYKSSPGRVTLQIRAPLLNSNFRPGCFGVIASALLNREDLTALRDGINISLEELS